MIFYYIRHGDPIYDPDSLTELGHKQADALSKRLSLYGLDEIYVSTSNRAKLTAQPTCEALGITPIECAWAHEALAWERYAVKCEDGAERWCFHDGPTLGKFHKKEVWAMGAKWYEHPLFQDTPLATSVPATNADVDAFMRSLGYDHNREYGLYRVTKENTKRVALFAHQGFGLAFLSSLLDIPYPQICTRFDFGHSSVTVVKFEQWGNYAYPKVLQLSNDSHLYKEGILTGYHNLFDI